MTPRLSTLRQARLRQETRARFFLRAGLRKGLPARRANPAPRVSFGTVEDGVLRVDHLAGFFSTCSVTLFELMRSHEAIQRIDTSRSLSLYRENRDGCIWDLFFDPPVTPLPTPDPSGDHQGLPSCHHRRYDTLDLGAFRPWVDTYFRPNEAVREARSRLVAKYGIDPDRTVAVWVRGTDKAIEVRPTPVRVYVRAVRRAIASGEVDRVLVQTDQEQVRRTLMRRFGTAAFTIDELPVTGDRTGLHSQQLPGREEHARDLLAAVLLMSRCRRLVLHTGNGAFWTVLFRGGCDGVLQL